MNNITYKPIGVIHSQFKEPRGTPIQPPGARGIEGRVELFPEYVEGLKDLDGFSHVILVYHFHRAKRPSLLMKPFMDDQPHGIFAIRAPSRPNPIGISVVRLVRIENNVLHIEDVDIIDGTPLLDIKPYVPNLIRSRWRRGAGSRRTCPRSRPPRTMEDLWTDRLSFDPQTAEPASHQGG